MPTALIERNETVTDWPAKIGRIGHSDATGADTRSEFDVSFTTNYDRLLELVASFRPALSRFAEVSIFQNAVAGVFVLPEPTSIKRWRRVPPDFLEDQAFFRRHKAELLESYDGQYLAIVQQEVVDHDVDFSVLAIRVYARFGYRPIYMPKVERAERIIRLPSPRKRRS